MLKFCKWVFLLFWAAAFCRMPVAAQRLDTTQHLPLFEVESPRKTQFSPGTKIQHVDSVTLMEYRGQNLGNLLAGENHMFIKSYGVGQLSTSTFRGGNANHTAVLWNGMNISSPLNGLTDLALLPVGFADKVSVEYGGGSALWGSGAVGGTVHLNNKKRFGQGVKTELSVNGGSFGQFGQSAAVLISKPKWVSSVNVFNRFSQNDFSYSNPDDPSESAKSLQNAAVRNRGVLTDHHLLTGNHRIDLAAWYQDTDRQLPPSLNEPVGKATQLDDALRLSANWIWSKPGFTLNTRAGFFREDQHYDDSLSGIHSRNTSNKGVFETELNVHLADQHKLNIGLNQTSTIASSTEYEQQVERHRTALFASYGFSAMERKLQLTASGRQGFVDGSRIPLTYSAGASYQLLEQLKLYANAGRVYRIPSLNDLYWSPGGNPGLLPEDGFTQEAGLALKTKVFWEGLKLEFQPSVFNRTMKNWIVWVPRGGYSSPQNVLEVWSRGTETTTGLSLATGKWTYSVEVLTSYVLSTSEKAISENDASVGKYLLYTPMYSGHAKFAVQHQRVRLAYRHHYTGYRYTSTDNYAYLEPYRLGGVSLSWNQQFNKTLYRIFGRVDNLWDEAYQVVSDRPMPGRNYQVGISIQFHQPNKSNKSKTKSQ